MDEHAKKGLNASKELHKRLREIEEGTTECPEMQAGLIKWAPLKKLAADANKAIQAMQKHAQDEGVRADVRESILREAVRDELIDREANAARVADRQRAVFEGMGEASVAAFDRANTAAASIEACVASLCPHQMQRAVGVGVLAEAATA